MCVFDDYMRLWRSSVREPSVALKDPLSHVTIISPPEHVFNVWVHALLDKLK